MSRTYSFVRVSRGFERLKADAELIAITNLQDGSTLARVTVTRSLRPSLAAYLVATEFLGREGSEMAFIQIARVMTFGLRLHF
jgi:hypothetical protein